MRILTSRVIAPAILAAGIFGAGTASAQATRTWVSGVGDDVNPCSRTAPCKTFAGAISKTASGGEINCLDPAGYGILTITKSITIDCTATLGSVLATSTTGFTINAADAKVILRGLTINGSSGQSSGLTGIRFIQGASLTVENVVIQNFTATGIQFQPSSAARLNVGNVQILQIGAPSSGSGIEIAPTAGGSARANLDGVRIVSNGNNGVRLNTANGTADVTIRDSVLSGNAQGLVVLAPANRGSASLVDSDVSNNSGTGILLAGAQARALVGNTTIFGNAVGVNAVSSATASSYGDNRLSGNTNDGAFTAAVAAKR